MNWYKISQNVLERVKGKTSPIPEWQREDKESPTVVKEVYPGVEWPMGFNYLDIGHEPSEDNRAYIWYMTRGHEFFMKEMEDHADGHHWWDEYNRDRESMTSIVQGRYETDKEGKNGICTIGSMRIRNEETERIHRLLDEIKKNFPAGTRFMYFGSRF